MSIHKTNFLQLYSQFYILGVRVGKVEVGGGRALWIGEELV